MMTNTLINGTKSFGLEMPEAAASAFNYYYKALEEKNKSINLTAITGKKDVAELHFLDSLALLTIANFSNRRVIDIGSGAGFPGLPLKIAESSIELTLLDAQQKKVAFLENVCRETGLKDVLCLHARAEEAAFDREMRDAFDFAVSRAVARLNVLSELCMPFVKIGGRFIAMKGTESDGEISEAVNAMKILGGQLDKIVDYEIPETGIIHRAVIIRKTAETPMGYPRRFAKIQKNPL